MLSLEAFSIRSYVMPVLKLRQAIKNSKDDVIVCCSLNSC